MKTLEVTITGISEYLINSLPKIRKNVRRNRTEYIFMSLYTLLMILNIAFGFYQWAMVDIINIAFIGIIVGYRNKLAAAQEWIDFYDELSTSLLRERHGIQRVTDIKFETSYDKENDIFNINKRIDPVQK